MPFFQKKHNPLMRQTILLLCCFLFLSNTLQAQKSGTVKGYVTDTINKSTLTKASVSLLRAKDSILVKFTRTKENGSFELNNIKAGKFILLVSYPKYADFVDQFAIDSTKSVSYTHLRAHETRIGISFYGL